MSAVLRPSTDDEVAQALRDAPAIRLVGGGTSARPAPDGASTVSLAGLAGVNEHRPTDLVATARAGTRLADLADALAPHGQRFPLAPPDPDGTGTIGGVFASGADGLLGTRAWRARDILLGARAVLPNGDRVRVGSSVVKSVAGFDVCKALVGSRGTLAAITEVTFRVEALPEAMRSLVFESDAEEDVQRACAAADRLALTPRGLAVVSASRTRVLVRIEGPWAPVEACSAILAEAGFERAAHDPFAGLLVPFLAADPDTVRTGRAPRARPLEGRPDDASFYVADVARERFVCVTNQSAARPVPSSLWTAVRKAFDPDGKLAPGRGVGAP